MPAVFEGDRQRLAIDLDLQRTGRSRDDLEDDTLAELRQLDRIDHVVVGDVLDAGRIPGSLANAELERP